MEIRWIIRHDIPRIMEIERATFDYPLSAAEMADLLRSKNTLGILCEEGDEILGYAIYDIFHDHIDLLTIAVDFKHRRCGVGSRLLGRLCVFKLNQLSGRRREYVSVMVRETNMGALLFFKDYGFKAIELKRSPYSETNEDGIVMEFRESVLVEV